MPNFISLLKKLGGDSKTKSLFFWAILGLGLLSVLLHQSNDWDFKNYHWYNAYALLHHRIMLDIAPAQWQTYFNPLADTFNYAIMHLLPFPFLYQFFFGALCFIPLYCLTKINAQLFKNLNAELRNFALVFALIIGITDHGFLAQIGVAFIDTENLIFIFAALYLVMQVLDAMTSKKSVPYMLLAGAMMGLAVGLKLTAIPFFVGILLAWCCYTTPSKRRLYLLLLFLCTFTLMALLMEGTWMFYMYHLFHNPLFPQFNDIFHSPYARILEFKDNNYLPTSFMQFILFPFYWLYPSNIASEGHFCNWRLPVCIILGLLTLIKFWVKPERKPYLLVTKTDRDIFSFILLFFIFSYLSWLKIFAIYRYLIPVALLSGTFLVFFAVYLFQNLSLGTQKRLILILSLVTIASGGYHPYGHAPFFQKTSIKTPPLPAHAYIIMATTTTPTAYLIPYFPETVYFISPLNNFMQLGEDTRFQTQISAIIHQQQYPLLVLNDSSGAVAPVLAYYHLHELLNTCQPISSNLDAKKTFSLCQLAHD